MDDLTCVVWNVSEDVLAYLLHVSGLFEQFLISRRLFARTQRIWQCSVFPECAQL
uniref:Uncharacterized protein n=1 Tax=Anguilla anguilla TaxID=7936 RepID=A0A0E9UXP2_ANGAN